MDTLASETQLAIDWFKVNVMEVQPLKPLAIFHRHWSKNSRAIIKSERGNMTSEPKAKLLGVSLDENLAFSYHVKELCRKAGARLNVLQRLAGFLYLPSRMATF